MREIVEQDLHSVKDLLQKALKVDRYAHIDRMGGLTNHTYRVTLEDGRCYVVRIPGEGTEDMINRLDEKKSTELACKLGVDAKMLYFGEDGSKVTEYIPNAVTMSSATLHEEENIEKVAQIFRKMHSCQESTGVPFEVFDMAADYLKIVEKMNVPMFSDFDQISRKVMEIKAKIDREFCAPKVPCHNDPLCENWVLGDGRMYLIDWEYAGMNDGMWDLADVSIEAGFSEKEDALLLRYYMDREPQKKDWLHFLASKIYVDYLWTLWAKARVPYDGQPMEDWAAERYDRLKDNLKILEESKGE